MKKCILSLLFILVFPQPAIWSQAAQGFTHPTSEAAGYQPPTQEAVREKLAAWQQMKFGILLHWGLYSVPGIVESWSICSEDVDWIPRRTDMNYDDYKLWYRSLADEFRPTHFDARHWAEVFRRAGARYAIFTTKHHDGYCLFSTRETDYSLPAHAGIDAADSVFRALRDEGLWAGAYFSKPDWSCPWYWHPHYATPNRRENYRRSQHPEWWEAYRKYTQSQLREILTQYAPLDILWLDGGWVSGDEIGLDTLLAEARTGAQEGLLAVDRTIRGRNENYLTPERGIPAEPLGVPWEACLPLSNDWGWVPDAPYKSWQRVVETLAEVVSKGGALLLGVGPCADGTLEAAVEERLLAVGEWLATNGEAIYGCTTPALTRGGEKLRPEGRIEGSEGRVWFTENAEKGTLYAIGCAATDTLLYIHAREAGATLWLKNLPAVRRVTLLSTGKKLPLRTEGDSLAVRLPRGLAAAPFVLKIELANDDAKAAKSQPTAEGQPPYLQLSDEELLSRLTLREKIGQLRCLMGWEMVERTGEGVRLTDKLREEMQSDYPAGGLWAVMRADPWTRRSLTNGLTPALSRLAADSLQAYAASHAAAGLPFLLAEECPHGHMAIGQTTFPTGLALASSWSEHLLRQVGARTGYEAADVGATLGLGPVLDVARDARWSRMEETLGEDALLTARLGTAFVEGVEMSLPTCLKHFAAYGVSEGGHNGGDALVGEHLLRRQLLPPFAAAVRAGASSVMTSYNATDGVPSTANSHLLRDILRGEWGFEGLVISDLFAIDGLVGHGLAANRKEAAALALRAGVDVDLGGSCYAAPLEAAVREGLVEEALVDSAFLRVLRFKRQAAARATKEVPEPAVPSASDFSECLVMLKNEGVLPLERGKRIAVIGPNADNVYNQLGDYTAPQPAGKVVTVLEGLRRHADAFASIDYVKGCAIRDTAQAEIARAVAAAKASDVVILVVGGSSARDFQTEYRETGAAEVSTAVSDMDCGEGFDRATLDLLGKQGELLEALHQTGKPLVTIYIEGRPLDMTRAAEASDALLCAWYPGELGGETIARCLLGLDAPSGHLPVSVPRSASQLPLYYAQGSQRDYMDLSAAPLYAFGHGLTYTQFSLRDLRSEGTDAQGQQQLSVEIENVGVRAGDAVVQLYQVPRSGRQPGSGAISLADFSRVYLEAGEKRRIQFNFIPEGTRVEVRCGLSSAETPLRLLLP